MTITPGKIEPSMSEHPSPPISKRRWFFCRWQQPIERAILGLALGAFISQIATYMGLVDLLPPLRQFDIFPVCCVVAMLLCLTRMRWVVIALSLLLYLAFWTVTSTPIICGPVHRWVEADPLTKCDAVVPLSSDVMRNGKLNDNGEFRTLRALELAHAGWASEVVLTAGPSSMPSPRSDVAGQMAAFGIDMPLDVVGPIENTHDEALAVARLARTRHWKRILVVTNALHTRRAAAVFRKTGLEIVVEPCVERRFDIDDLSPGADRIEAFSSWIREVVGYRVYRHRGWV